MSFCRAVEWFLLERASKNHGVQPNSTFQSFKLIPLGDYLNIFFPGITDFIFPGCGHFSLNFCDLGTIMLIYAY